MATEVQHVRVTSAPPARRLRLVLVIGSLSAFGPLSMDAYLPGLPALGRDLGGSPSATQATITGCLVGLAAGQVLVGPMSDALGRRRPLLVGIALYVAAIAPVVGSAGARTALPMAVIMASFAAAGLLDLLLVAPRRHA